MRSWSAARVGPSTSGGARFENIDALRGIAAVLVVWLHTAEVFVTLPGIASGGTGAFDAAELISVGRVGVVAFFAISGYVIVPTLQGPRREATVDFVVKRAFRLFPAFWTSMALAAVTVWVLFDKALTPALIVANATMMPLEFGQPQMMGHFWTLEVELIFYAVVLGLFWCGRLHRESTIAVLFLLLSIAWAALYRNRYGRLLVDRNLVWSYLVYFLTVMFWGSMVRSRHAVRSRDTARERRDWPFMVMTALVFGRPVIALIFGSPTVHREDWRGTLLGLLLFIAAIYLPVRYGKPFLWLGTISYSLYLFHPAVFYPMFLWVSRHPETGEAPLAVYIVASLAASIAVAALGYRWIEAPSNRVARRLVARMHEGGRVVRTRPRHVVSIEVNDASASDPESAAFHGHRASEENR